MNESVNARHQRAFPRRHSGLRASLAALALVVGVSALLSPTAARADDAIDRYNFAVKLYQQKRWQQAADAYADFLDKHPQHEQVPAARFYQGLSLVEAGDHKAARDVLRAFAAAYPQDKNVADALYRVGWCSHQLADLKAADAEFTKFAELFPKHALLEWALTYLGDAQLRLEKFKEAAASFRRSLELHPTGRMSAESRWGLARAAERLNDDATAVEQYKALAAQPEGAFAARAQFSLGTRHFDAGRFAEAAEAYANFSRRFAQHELAASADLNAGYAWYQVGDYRKAIQQFDAAAAHKGQELAARYWKAVSHKALREYDQASAVLKAVFEAAPDGPQAQDALFQWAVCEHAAGRYSSARTLFLDAVARWPQGQFAEDSLHFATEAALLEARAAAPGPQRDALLTQTSELLERFSRTFPSGKLRMRQEILRGRMLEARGSEADRKAAVETFGKVIASSEIPRTQLLARYYLAETLSQLGQHKEAAAAIAPVVEDARKTGASSEFIGSLVLAGEAHSAAGDPKQAAALLTQYLELQPQGPQAEEALAGRALALARLGDKAKAQLDLDTLGGRSPQGPLWALRSHEIAEVAYAAGDYEWSTKLFQSLARLGSPSKYYPVGLSGEAWSLYHAKKFDEAAAAFDRYLREFPGDADKAAEAAYMRGQALEAAGKLELAVEAYDAAFQKFAPPQAAPAGAEQERPLRFAWLAGLQAARVNATRKDVQAADAAYSRLLEKFPQPASVDKLLDEWALMNLESGNYERSDQVFARLVREAPESDLADNARMSLAESQFVNGKFDEAKQAFRALVTAEKSDDAVKERSLFQLMQIASEQKAWDELRTAAENLRNAFPNSKHRWEALYRLAEADLWQKKYEAARRTLEELKAQKADAAVRAEPWFAKVFVLLAETLVQLKQYAAVPPTVEELAALDPKSPMLHEGYEVLGRSYKNQAKFAEARAAFQKTLDDDASRGTETAAKARLMIAETWWNQQKYDLAQRDYLKVYHLHTEHPEWQAPALFQAAVCDEKLGQWRNAADAYQELLNKFPNSDLAAKAGERLKLAREKASAG
ncbi:MAG: tetratricopeptide repeat protein [Planctomycetes bacterium]|nr:tetratricopeptide repeat protein [Planctomycetota bacterium]